MVTKEQALTQRYFHEEGCARVVGLRGGIKTFMRLWRANGECRTWKTRPNAFRLPVKRGLKEYGYITESNMQHFHVESECPVLRAGVEQAIGQLVSAL